MNKIISITALLIFCITSCKKSNNTRPAPTAGMNGQYTWAGTKEENYTSSSNGNDTFFNISFSASIKVINENVIVFQFASSPNTDTLSFKYIDSVNHLFVFTSTYSGYHVFSADTIGRNYIGKSIIFNELYITPYSISYEHAHTLN